MAIKKGDKVEAIQVVNIRDDHSTIANDIGDTVVGEQGVALADEITDDGWTWAWITWDNGTTGFSIVNGLRVIEPAPVPEPEPEPEPEPVPVTKRFKLKSITFGAEPVVEVEEVQQ